MNVYLFFFWLKRARSSPFRQIHGMVGILERFLFKISKGKWEKIEKSTYSNVSPGKLIPKSATTTFISFAIIWINETKSIVPHHKTLRVHYIYIYTHWKCVANTMGFLTQTGRSRFDVGESLSHIPNKYISWFGASKLNRI